MKAIVLEDPAAQSLQQHHLDAYNESGFSSPSLIYRIKVCILISSPGDLAGQETVRSSVLEGNYKQLAVFPLLLESYPWGLFEPDS